MNPPGDACPVSFTLHGGDIAPEPTGSSRVSSGKKMPKVFAGWRFVLAPPPLPSLRLDRPARRSVTFEQELEPGMDVLREQTPEPSGFDSDEADSRAQRRSSGSGRDRRRRLLVRAFHIAHARLPRHGAESASAQHAINNAGCSPRARGGGGDATN